MSGYSLRQNMYTLRLLGYNIVKYVKHAKYKKFHIKLEIIVMKAVII